MDFKKDYLTIKEFAEIVGVTPEALRYYHRIGVFIPAKVGTELKNLYRLYDPTQVTTFKMIKVLVEIGVPLKAIAGLSENRTPESLLKLITKYDGKIESQLEELENEHVIIGVLKNLLIEGISATETEIHVSEQQERRIILGKRNNFEGAVGFNREFLKFCNDPGHDPPLNLSFPVGGFFDSMETFMAEPSQPTHFFSLDPSGHQKLDTGLYLIGFTRGYYGQTNDLPERLIAYAKKNRLEFNGPVYNIYLFDEVSIANTNQYLLQVSAQIKESRKTKTRQHTHNLT